jgi:hypothetical protein
MSSLADLKAEAKALGLRGYSTLRKHELRELLEKHKKPAPAPMKVKRVKKPLAERKHFKAGLAKTKEALAKGVVKSAVERAVAKYKDKKAKLKSEPIVNRGTKKIDAILRRLADIIYYFTVNAINSDADIDVIVHETTQPDDIKYVSEIILSLGKYLKKQSNEKTKKEYNEDLKTINNKTIVTPDFNMTIQGESIVILRKGYFDWMKMNTYANEFVRDYLRGKDEDGYYSDENIKYNIIDASPDEWTEYISTKNSEYVMPTEKAKNVGNVVFGIPELARGISEYLPGDLAGEVKNIEGERNRKAEYAVSLQNARVKSMKNEALKEYTEALINHGGILQIFDKSLSEYVANEGKPLPREGDYLFRSQWIKIDGGADNNVQNDDEMGAVVFSDTEPNFGNENGDPIDMEEAETVFEDFHLGWANMIWGYKNVKSVLPEELDRYLEYMWMKGELKERQVYKNYWVQVFGTHKEIAGDDAKFYKVYLKKKFNYDVDAELKKARAEKKTKKDEEKAEATAKKTSKKEHIQK